MIKRLMLSISVVLACFCYDFCLFGYQQPTEEIQTLQEVILYEVNLRAFSEGGDLQGVIDRLDEIKQLGANVIWLMPIHPVGEINQVPPLGSPYSVKNYRAVSSEYGSLEVLNQLIDAAHAREMSVIMDFVANHTAWDHPWVINNPDWYSQDENGEIIHPPGTNWLDVADLNYGNLQMRAAMIDEMTYWVNEVGIDGFRMDAADFVPFDFWQTAITALRCSASKPLLMLAEGARPDHYLAGFDLTFGWQFYGQLKDVFSNNQNATMFWQAHLAEYAAVPSGREVLRFTTNHDESAFDATPPILFGGLDASRAAFTIAMFYGGTTLVYGSQEIGWLENIPFFDQVPVDWTTGQETEMWYRQILEVQRRQTAVQFGSVDDYSNSDVVFVLRQLESMKTIALVSTRGFDSAVAIPGELQGSWYDLLTESTQTIGSEIVLTPFQIKILGSHLSDVGDVNLDGNVNLLDIGPFVKLLGDGQFQSEADINGDGLVNLLDVAHFVELLSGD